METQSKTWKGRAALFLISQSVTLFGSTLVQMAIIWNVALDTSSGTWVSALTVAAYLPQFIVSFAGGVLADRHSKKALIIIADTAIALATLALAIAMPRISGEGPFLWAILGVTALRSVGAGIQTPAVNAAIPMLVPESELMRFNGINATAQSIVQFAAPAAAGAVLSFSTLRSALFIDVATAAVAIAVLAPLVLPKRTESGAPSGIFEDMKAGVAYAFSNKPLLWVLVLYGLFIFLSVPAGFLATLFVSRTFGESYFYLTAVELVGFFGMSAGGLLMSIWGGFKSRVATLLWALVLFGVLAVLMGFSQSFVFYLVLMLIYGVALTAVQTSSTTLVQENADPAVQGRVFGLMGAAYSGFLPLGMAIFGPLADAVSLRLIMAASGGALMALALVGATGLRRK